MNCIGVKLGKKGECYDGEVRKGCECRKTENDKWSFAKI